MTLYFIHVSNLNLPIHECAKLKGLQITCTVTVTEDNLRKPTMAEGKCGLLCSFSRPTRKLWFFPKLCVSHRL